MTEYGKLRVFLNSNDCEQARAPRYVDVGFINRFINGEKHEYNWVSSEHLINLDFDRAYEHSKFNS